MKILTAIVTSIFLPCFAVYGFAAMSNRPNSAQLTANGEIGYYMPSNSAINSEIAPKVANNNYICDKIVSFNIHALPLSKAISDKYNKCSEKYQNVK